MEYDYLKELFCDGRPTQFDRRIGTFAKAQSHANWFIVISQNRDSKALDVSNFECATDMLKVYGESAYAIHRFGHWACGWYEVLIVNPDDKEACKDADNILRSLEGYPVLDDEHYSAKQCELEECECDCCPKDWCDCESCKAHRGDNEDEDLDDDEDLDMLSPTLVIGKASPLRTVIDDEDIIL